LSGLFQAISLASPTPAGTPEKPLNENSGNRFWVYVLLRLWSFSKSNIGENAGSETAKSPVSDACSTICPAISHFKTQLLLAFDFPVRL
tara:strand:+ start:79 stop:345 length:267 start_codon:yes stop_codon:yes gene_type:complete